MCCVICGLGEIGWLILTIIESLLGGCDAFVQMF